MSKIGVNKDFLARRGFEAHYICAASPPQTPPDALGGASPPKGDGGGRIFLEDPTPINPRRDNISRKGNPSLRYNVYIREGRLKRITANMQACTKLF